MTDTTSARPTKAALDALLTELDGIKVETGESIVRQKSRDYYWYSPVLKERLDGVLADLVVTPADEAQVIRAVAACHRHDVPLTARGKGTGNYGQAMPLAGGVVLNLADMDDIREIAPGRVTCGPGAVCEDIDVACRAHSGQELRMHPSTGTLASIGGFVAGGSGGIGSTRWGGLRDAGNVLGLRVVTMEAEPRTLELTGDDVAKVIHAYGTNGIITEVEMPLTAAYEWVDVLLGFADFMYAASFCDALANQDGILVKLNCTVAAPAPEAYFRRHRAYVEPGESLAILMVAPQSLDAALAFAHRHGARVAWNSAGADETTRKKVPPVYQLTWSHTTLRALKEDSGITYLQVLYPFPHQLELVRTLHERFEGEVIDHLEFVRFDGDNTCFGLPLVRYTTEAAARRDRRGLQRRGRARVQSAPLHAGGGRHEGDGRGAARVQARRGPEGALEPRQDDRPRRSRSRLRQRRHVAVQGARRARRDARRRARRRHRGGLSHPRPGRARPSRPRQLQRGDLPAHRRDPRGARHRRGPAGPVRRGLRPGAEPPGARGLPRRRGQPCPRARARRAARGRRGAVRLLSGLELRVPGDP